tara:strand:+ start:2764 stop:3204 length:441 start_codon:yes stop_codon:yes gene_type:complete
MAFKMPKGSETRRAASAKREQMERQFQMQKKIIKMQEKPWYEKYLIEPAMAIATNVGAGALGEALSPAKAAATAASKARTATSEAATAATKQTTKFAATKETDRVLTDAVAAMRQKNPNISNDEIGKRLRGDENLYKRWTQGSWRQ